MKNTGNLHRKFDAQRKSEFLDILAVTGRPAQAAREVGVSLSTVSKHRWQKGERYDAEFAAGYDAALALYREMLSEEVERRGVKGVEEPVFYQGKVATDKNGKPLGIVKFSDRMLELLIKRNDPTFRDRQIVEQTTISANAGLEDLSKLSPESRRKLREILEAEGGEPETDVS